MKIGSNWINTPQFAGPEYVKVTQAEYTAHKSTYDGSGDVMNIVDATTSIAASDVSFVTYEGGTSSTNVQGALSEAYGKRLTTTLAAGQTSYTFTDDAITDTSIIEVYLDPSITLSSYTQTGHTFSFTIPAQTTTVTVLVVVK